MTVVAILRRHALAVAWVLPLALAEVGLDGGLTLSYRYLIDRAIVPGNGRALAVVLGALGAGVVLASLASVWRDRAYAKRVAAVLADLRAELFDHVQRLSIGFFARTRSGDVTARFSTDLAGLEAAIVSLVGAVLLPALGVLVGVALLFVVLDWKLALVASLVWPIVLVGPRWVGPRAASAAYEKKQLEASLLVRVDEAVAAQKTIKAFGLEPFARGRFVERLSPLSFATSRATFLSSMVERTTVVTIYAVQVGAVAAGAVLAYRREVSVGALVSFLTIFWNLGWSLVVIGRATPALVSAGGSARRIDELLAEPSDPADARDLPVAPALRGAIAAEDVTFSYDGKHPALLFASFAIAPGQSVAFVGASGSGKSTALSLVARFYDPSKGIVRFDDVDGRSVSAASLRAQMGFVMQESFLFDASIRENIRLGRPDATDADVEDAARDAEIHDAIAAMPDGYDTIVGERGGHLSGGQRQRVAIARALVRKPRILLLDEASSALDPISESAINATLARIGRGRTTVAVTHRLAGVVDADRIFVVSEQRIVESGTHAELLARGRAYAELWKKQSGFSVSADGASATVSGQRLRAIALLAPLGEEHLAALAKILACQRASAGQRVIAQGEAGSLFYLIARGVVRVTRHGDDGEEVEIARLDDGDQFGELALLRDAPRSATVTCLTDCVFLTLTRAEFLELLATSQDVRARVERVAGERRAALRGTNLAMTLQ